MKKIMAVILLFFAAVGLTGFTAGQPGFHPLVKFDRTIYLDGQIEGDVILFAKEVTVNATISGDLIVFPARADMQKLISHFKPNFKVIAGLILLEKLASLTIEILIGWLLIALLPQLIKQLVNLGLKQPGAAIGWGLLFLTVIPLLACFFIISLIGIPLGVVTILIYLISLSLAKLLAGLSLGSRLLKDARFNQPYLSLALGLTIMVILQLIPFFGWLAYFILILFGLGLLTLRGKTFITRLKQ